MLRLRTARSLRWVLPFLALAGASCVRPHRLAQTVPATIADEVRSETLAKGVVLHHLVSRTAPWRAEVLDVDLRACNALRAVKGGDGAAGRRTTSALLDALPGAVAPIAAVNADFFNLANGAPLTAHVEHGVLVAGPGDRPVFGVTRDGRPWIGRMTVRAELRTSRGSAAVTSWNRPTRNVPGVIDGHWGMPLDSTVQGARWRLVPVRGGAYVAAAWPRERASVVRGDTLLLVEWRNGSGVALTDGDTVRVTREVTPDVPEAVGGFPLLATDSVRSRTIEVDGAAGFRGLNPRTAVGIAAGGRRVFLAVIDGRQPGTSVGMTTRETADFMLALGAHDALNLDGGGSSALVVRGAGTDSTRVRVVNHPSDAAGERAVGNALAVVGSCSR